MSFDLSTNFNTPQAQYEPKDLSDWVALDSSLGGLQTQYDVEVLIEITYNGSPSYKNPDYDNVNTTGDFDPNTMTSDITIDIGSGSGTLANPIQTLNTTPALPLNSGLLPKGTYQLNVKYVYMLSGAATYPDDASVSAEQSFTVNVDEELDVNLVFNKGTGFFGISQVESLSDPSNLVPNICQNSDIEYIVQIKKVGDSNYFYKNQGWDTNDFSDPDFKSVVDGSGNTTESNLNNIPIPTDSFGNIVRAEYELEYKIKYTSEGVVSGSCNYVQLMDGKTIQTDEVIYESPNVCVDITVDCETPVLKIVDNTDYTVNSVDPTLLDRTISLTPPSDIDDSNTQTSTDKTLYTSYFWTNTNQADVKTNLEYSFSSGNYAIVDVVKFHDDVPVNCSQKLCSLLCCLENLRKRMFYAKTKNRAKADEMERDFNKASSLISFYRTAEVCASDGIDKNAIVEEIEHLTNCKCGDCKCGDKSVSKVVEGAPSAIIQQPKENKQITFTAGQTITTYQNSNLVGVANNDLLVFIEGRLSPNTTLNSQTGTITFPYNVYQNEIVSIFIHG